MEDNSKAIATLTDEQMTRLVNMANAGIMLIPLWTKEDIHIHLTPSTGFVLVYVGEFDEPFLWGTGSNLEEAYEQCF